MRGDLWLERIEVASSHLGFARLVIDPPYSHGQCRAVRDHVQTVTDNQWSRDETRFSAPRLRLGPVKCRRNGESRVE